MVDPIPEIKARLPIEELVGSYVQIQRKGRSFVALCPFHNDTRPSLLVSPNKGIAYCFACQSGGDIFTFYQKIENVGFREALKDLAERAGVALPKEQFVAGPKQDERERIRECLASAVSFYQARLKEHERAQQYLAERKVTPELQGIFRIGFAPDSFDATYTHLLKAGFSRKEILSAGLGIQKELKEERIYDRFRNRIMFPIQDHQGNVIGFGGRTLGTEDAKYINSPDGPLYNKSIALFGLALAKEAIREAKKVILVEGYFDLIACHRLGIRSVVAVSGTALTEQHAGILKRYAEKVMLCLDADAAGTQAAERAFCICAKHGLEVSIIELPTGKDPDECSLLAPEDLRKMCADGGVRYLDKVFREIERGTPDKRTALQRLLPLLRSIPSAVEREGEVQRAAAALGTTTTALEDDLRRYRPPPPAKQPKERSIQTGFTSMELFLGFLLTYPVHLRMVERVIEPEAEAEKALYAALKSLRNVLPGEFGVTELPAECRERASVLQLYCEEHFGAWSESMAGKEIRKLCRKVNCETLLRKQQELLLEIREARTLGRKLEEAQLLTQYQQVLKLAAMTS